MAATPAALAKDLDLFGILYIEAGSVEEGNNAESRNYFGDENGMGRFGFKGSHKINDDLSLVGYAAWNLNVGDANDEKAGNKSITITDRDHNVGFKGNFGEIVFGSFDGAYKETGGAKYDAFASTALQARGNGGMAT
ncbi:MAG: porin, partial [Thiotrichales bacterium]